MQRKTKPSEQTPSKPRSRQRTVANTQLAVAGTNTSLAVQPSLFTPETPQSTSAPVQSSTIVLGRNQQTGAPITLGVEELYAGLHILGIPRHGKTALLINIFLQLAQKGCGCAYVDPHGDAINDLLARLPRNRLDDVILLDPTHETHAFGLNLLHCDNPASDTAITYAYDQLWSVFNKLWADKETCEMGIWMQKFVSNAILTFLEHPGMTVADIPLLLKSKAHRVHFAKTLKNREVAEFWLTEFDSLPKNYQWVEIESTLTRLNRFLQNPILRSIVGQSQSTLRFRQIIDTKKLLLVKIPRRLPDDFKNMLGTMLVTQLLDAMFSRDDIAKSQRVPFFLIVDEVERFAVPEFGAFFEEGGKYHVGTIAAHQHLFQEGLNSAVRNSLLTAGNKVYLRVNDSDAEIVAPGFAKEPQETILTVPRDVIPFLKYHDHPFVKKFYAVYLAPIEVALGKQERYEHESYMTMSGGHVNKTITILPKWNFGTGEMEYETDTMRWLEILWDDLLYETMEQKLTTEQLHLLWQTVVVSMSSFLDFHTYYECKYRGRCPDITPRLAQRTSEANEAEAKLYPRIEELDRILASDDTLVEHLFMSAWYKTSSTADCYRELERQSGLHAETARNLGSFEGFVANLRKGWEHGLTELERDREVLLKKTKTTFWQEFDMWYGRNFKYGKTCGVVYEVEIDRRRLEGVEEKIAQYKQALASEDALLAQAEENGYLADCRQKGIRVAIAEFLAQQAEKVEYYRETDTPEKWLSFERRKLENERDFKQRTIEGVQTGLEKSLIAIKESIEAWLNGEKTRHDNFTANLDTLLKILQHPKGIIRVPASNTNNQRDKTAREMIDLTAMELRSLPKYQALCKIVYNTTTVTNRISLLPLPDSHSGQLITDMTACIWERMEKEYYRSKETINNEITRRQHLPSTDTGAFVKLPKRTEEMLNAADTPH